MRTSSSRLALVALLVGAMALPALGRETSGVSVPGGAGEAAAVGDLLTGMDLAIAAGVASQTLPLVVAQAEAPDQSATAARSLGEVVNALEAQGYTDFREIERDDGRYEVEARNSEGKMVEVYVDTVTLKVVGDEGSGKGKPGQ
jgi:Peptidase propeptide and YPEB domain